MWKRESERERDIKRKRVIYFLHSKESIDLFDLVLSVFTIYLRWTVWR